jgi:outer membrane protein insertion porin family
LTDRFFLGEPQFRGFDIRGVGPRVIRQPIVADPASPDPLNPNPLVVTDRNRVSDDSLGGKYYYLGRAELEIPLGSGAKELGLRPSIFMDVGALWGVRFRDPQDLTNSPFPGGIDFPIRDANGNALYTQINVATLVTPAGGGTPICTPGSAAGDVTTVTSPTNPNPPSCLTNNMNSALTKNIGPFKEVLLGDTPSPRLSVGIGVNWNTPFGPFRIDFAHALLKEPGDDTKRFTFNVGTQF